MQGVGDLLGRPLRHPDVVHLALPHQIVEGAQRLFERGGVVVAMGLKQIDVVGLETLERTIDRFDDVFRDRPRLFGFGPVGQ